jgi:apoptosis-inducing factor 2
MADRNAAGAEEPIENENAVRAGSRKGADSEVANITEDTNNDISFNAGHLNMLGGSIRSWKQTWIRLTDDKLLYFKKEDEKKLIGSIALKGFRLISAVVPDDAESKKLVGKKEFCFFLEPVDDSVRKCYFQAASVEERDSWIQSIDQARLVALSNAGLIDYEQDLSSEGNGRRRKVVIVGGGFAGAYSALFLQHSFDVTLVDNKDFFEYTPSVLRAVVDPKTSGKIRAYHRQYFVEGELIVGRATSVDSTTVTVDVDGEERKVNYDHLLICSGSRYESRIKAEDIHMNIRAEYLSKLYNEMYDCKSVLVVGGGAVGVELAAEIATYFPKKDLTLVHSRERLLERCKPSVSTHAQKFLTKKGVKLVLGERLLKSENGVLVTDKGTTLNADLKFMAVGIVPNTEWCREYLGEALERGLLKVDEHFAVEGHPNIFALGDCCSVAEEKLAQNARFHAEVVAHNLLCSIRGDTNTKSYESAPRPMLISLGNRTAIFLMKGLVWKGLSASKIKDFAERRTMRDFRSRW